MKTTLPIVIEPAEARFLKVVVKHGPDTASNLGSFAYGGSQKPQAYARPGGNMLRRLALRGWVIQESTYWGVYWRITREGKKALESLERTK